MRLYFRQELIDSIDQETSSLEIGPYYNPNLRGKNTKYFDVLSKDELIKLAKAEKLTRSNIPHIDYVEPYGDMSVIKEKFDSVFSSHNIEHQVDLVRHLQQVSNVLKDGGKFYLFIPDKRYCFDHYIAETPLSEVLAVYESNLKSHSLQTILSMKCETTHSTLAGHWTGDNKEITGKDLNCYKHAIEEFKAANSNYINSHKWRFTPQSFSYIITSLNAMGLTDLKVEKVYCSSTYSHEFKAVLYK